MKSKSNDDTKSSSPGLNGLNGLKKGFSSTPDLKANNSVPLMPLEELKTTLKAKTDIDLIDLHVTSDLSANRGYFTLPSSNKLKKFPPPEHAPPPPPVEVMMKVKSPEKANNNVTSPIMSSFKPDSADYSEPKSLQPEFKQRSPPSRANSMPPRPSRPQVLKKAVVTSEAAKETYSINGINYTTYTTFR